MRPPLLRPAIVPDFPTISSLASWVMDPGSPPLVDVCSHHADSKVAGHTLLLLSFNLACLTWVTGLSNRHL